ncbi:reverse transcriptase domain-containing protein [Acidaminococcus intestini]|uniref:reverse transcriptase domain-containing protein n=1 Tax=Acidaminococcus intestini TaxID=187327 RepID=UPI00399B7B3B
MIQQAITQELTLVYEPQFSDSSFGFRPGRKAHDALKQCKAYADAGYVYVVDMDLEKFFDNVCQSKLVEVLSRSIKDGAVISLIHKYLVDVCWEWKGVIYRVPREKGLEFQQLIWVAKSN